jgi:hypothetical protein
VRLFRWTVGAVVFGAALLLAGCSDTMSPMGDDPSMPDGPDGSDGGSMVQFDSEALPGDSARSFLTDRRFSVLSVEVDYMAGYRPTGEAPDDVRAVEEKHRNRYTDAQSDTLRAYFIVLDGKRDGNENVVGFAYYNTSMAFFGETIDEVSGGVTQPSRAKVEATVFRHEFGHNHRTR